MPEQDMSDAPEGWGWLSNSPKWHYFNSDGRSLCGRWMTFSRKFQQGNNGSPDNCAACRKKADRLPASPHQDPGA